MSENVPQKNESEESRKKMVLSATGIGILTSIGKGIEDKFSETEADIITDGITLDKVKEKGILGAAIDMVRNMTVKSGFTNRLLEIYSSDELNRIANDEGLRNVIKQYCGEHPVK